MLCERPHDGVTLNSEGVANRATSFHAKCKSAEIFQPLNDRTGSRGRALNTVVHGGARGSRG